ncbi:MAG TPA: CxxxxCH/CxxCH domain-containing protein [Holophagaceae bacterium]|nr:CxxxxCH/CxxCH domain-containing protein [Holophagaceae bacterium]
MGQGRTSRIVPPLGSLGLTLGLGLGLASGCGGGRSSTTAVQYYHFYHPSDWLAGHGGQAMIDLGHCRTCHELNLLRAGNGVPNCLTSECHHRSTADFATAGIHGLRAKMGADASGGSFSSCQMCHGQDFTGGPSASSCMPCHGVPAPHPPKPWRDTLASGTPYKHSDTDPSNALVCYQCHSAGSVNNPIDPLTGKHYPKVPPLPGASPDCFNNTLCHAGVGHPIPFTKDIVTDSGNHHYTTDTTVFNADCITCHAVSGPGPLLSAPACVVCHTATQNPVLATATGAGTCLSCHAAGPSGLPQGPTGTAFPDIKGSHAKHMALAGVTCSACHSGREAGSLIHYQSANARKTPPTGPAPVAFHAVYNAQSGAAAWDAVNLTCSNVSCHGGKSTPNWRTGALPAAGTYANCQACHQVRSTTTAQPQYNDAVGRHADPSDHVIDCTYCHDMANGSPGALAHWKYLQTPAVDGTSGSPADQLPSGTISFTKGVGAGVITNVGTPAYDVTNYPQGHGGCALTCHTEQHTASDKQW